MTGLSITLVAAGTALSTALGQLQVALLQSPADVTDAATKASTKMGDFTAACKTAIG